MPPGERLGKALLLKGREQEAVCTQMPGGEGGRELQKMRGLQKQDCVKNPEDRYTPKDLFTTATAPHDSDDKGHNSLPRFLWKHMMWHKGMQQVAWQVHPLDIWNSLHTGARMDYVPWRHPLQEKEGVYLPSPFLSSANHWSVLTTWGVNSSLLPGGSPGPVSGHSGCQIPCPVVWCFI